MKQISISSSKSSLVAGEPTVIMRGNDSDPVYAGTEFVLNISITFSEKSIIDVDISFTFVLSGGYLSSDEQANIAVNNDRITLSTDSKLHGYVLPHLLTYCHHR